LLLTGVGPDVPSGRRRGKLLPSGGGSQGCGRASLRRHGVPASPRRRGAVVGRGARGLVLPLVAAYRAAEPRGGAGRGGAGAARPRTGRRGGQGTHQSGLRVFGLSHRRGDVPRLAQLGGGRGAGPVRPAVQRALLRGPTPGLVRG